MNQRDSFDLSSVSAIRLRPAMYVGDMAELGMRHAVCGVISNAVDQVLNGHATFVDVSMQPDGRTFGVRDDGAGLPFDLGHAESGVPLATWCLTRIHDEPTVDGHAPHIHLHDDHGCGVVLANALSSRLDCESWRNGLLWTQSFERGVETGPASSVNDSCGRGTIIRFTLDEEVFEDNQLDALSFRAFLREKASLFPGLELRFNDESLLAPHGLVDLASDLLSEPVRHEDAFQMNATFDDMTIHATAAGHAVRPVTVRAWANGYFVCGGGTHLSAFEKALNTIGWTPAIVMIHVVMRDPRFAGPTRGTLEMPEYETAIHDRIVRRLRDFQRS